MTTSVVHLIQMELDIASLAKVVGDYDISKHFFEAAQAREKAISSVFWNAEMGQWLDYWLNDSSCKVLSTCFNIFITNIYESRLQLV